MISQDMTLRMQRRWYGYRVIAPDGRELFRIYWWSAEVIQTFFANLFRKY